MIRPKDFYCNPQTILDNHFQSIQFEFTREDIERSIQEEFEEFVSMLRHAGVTVYIFEQDDGLDTPDAIFPNNWFSTHEVGKLVLYPMKALNRRMERRKEIIEWLGTKYQQTVDLSAFELQGKFLEGTGSLVLDRENKLAFAAISDRTHPKMVVEWGRRMDYQVMLFSAADMNGNPIYHTNVALCLGEDFALVGMDSIRSATERHELMKTLIATGREIIPLQLSQVHSFSANGIQLKDREGNPVFVISQTGWDALYPEQKNRIERSTRVLIPALRMTEQLGGGSARCMVAELF
ncbi:MAG: citrulline utilization hydrolase CtlX [Bacteroidota bacterium]